MGLTMKEISESFIKINNGLEAWWNCCLHSINFPSPKVAKLLKDYSKFVYNIELSQISVIVKVVKKN